MFLKGHSTSAANRKS